MDVKKLRECGLAALVMSLAVGCGGDSSAPGASSNYEGGSGESAPAEVPMMTMGNTSATEEAGPGAPPPDGLAPSSETVTLKGFDKDEKGAPLPVQSALQQVVDTYQRLRPTSSEEEGQPMWPMLTNVNQLVQVGLVRAIPPAPAGKQWSIDKDYRVQAVSQ